MTADERDTIVEAGDGGSADRGPIVQAAGARAVWWLLAAWFGMSLAACASYAVWIAPLGWGALVYLLFGGPVVVAQFGLATLWMWLGDDTRLARFADLPMGMALLAIVFSRSLEDNFDICWPIFQLVVLTSLPLVLPSLRGLRITRRQVARGVVRSWWQFGIGDLLVATTCLAAVMGVVLPGPSPVSDALWLLFLASPAWLTALLGFRGTTAFRGLLATCLAFGLFVAFILADEVLDGGLVPVWLNYDLRLFTVLAGMQLLPLTLAAAVLRRLGFRLRAVG